MALATPRPARRDSSAARCRRSSLFSRRSSAWRTGVQSTSRCRPRSGASTPTTAVGLTTASCALRWRCWAWTRRPRTRRRCCSGTTRTPAVCLTCTSSMTCLATFAARRPERSEARRVPSRVTTCATRCSRTARREASNRHRHSRSSCLGGTGGTTAAMAAEDHRRGGVTPPDAVASLSRRRRRPAGQSATTRAQGRRRLMGGAPGQTTLCHDRDRRTTGHARHQTAALTARALGSGTPAGATASSSSTIRCGGDAPSMAPPSPFAPRVVFQNS